MIYKPERTQLDFQNFHGWQIDNLHSCNEHSWWKDSKWIILECCICRTGQQSWKHSYLTSTVLFRHVKWCVCAWSIRLWYKSQNCTLWCDNTSSKLPQTRLFPTQIQKWKDFSLSKVSGSAEMSRQVTRQQESISEEMQPPTFPAWSRAALAEPPEPSLGQTKPLGSVYGSTERKEGTWHLPGSQHSFLSQICCCLHSPVPERSWVQGWGDSSLLPACSSGQGHCRVLAAPPSQILLYLAPRDPTHLHCDFINPLGRGSWKITFCLK